MVDSHSLGRTTRLETTGGPLPRQRATRKMIELESAYDTLTVTPLLKGESWSCSDLIVSPVASWNGTTAWIETPGFTVDSAELLLST